ncbi:cobalt-precorrin-5B (C(1))-methyltransferase CbiD [Mediterraneibacter glycyrrhizinilyticus]|uniref:cobalt-precorrin-5B (C(1))-methyltransferase CbiD n=1 Tax=Mediterraneibacter glycyrrhizinilyticus TaxID=342942 RepID=UPI000AA96B71
MKNNSEVWVEQKKMRTGYTTGSCAAAAAKAAVCMLLSGEVIQQVRLMTPKGVELDLEVEQIQRRQHGVRCAVRKDSGDDPDVTNGIYVYAEVRKEPEPGIYLDGGEGIGRITKKGLEQPVGAAAINRVPRQMILEAVKEQSIRYGYQGGFSVIISAPEGKKLAAKTFNPRLGIENGISILGTSGIVEPMSEKALTDTIFLEMKMLKENGIDRCCVVPGNYGRDFLAEQLGVDTDQAVKCSNYIGETIDAAVNLEMRSLLLIGHIGKLIKVAAGVMNTHSRQADCRMEVLAAYAAAEGASAECVQAILSCITTTEALELLKEKGILSGVMERVMERIDFHLRHRVGGSLQVEAIVFSTEDGILGKTKRAEALLKEIRAGAE